MTNIEGRQVLVTGADGFIGSHLVERLVAGGANVRAFCFYNSQGSWGWLDQVHLEDRERVRESWRAAVKSGAPFTSELRIRNAGGAYRWFRTHAVPLRDAAGAITKWYAMSTDIDDLKAASPSVGAHPER